MNTRTTTWDGIGRDISRAETVVEALRASGLDYTVIKKPVFAIDGANSGYSQVPNRFVTARQEDGHVYDVVSDKFTIVQNREAFDFVNFMGEELTFEKAGETANGMVYLIAALPEVDILGDVFTPHVIFRNGFSGKYKITAAICPLRVVCQNQFNFAFSNTQNAITIRHISNVSQKLEEAKGVLKLSADYMRELDVMAKKYATMRLTEAQLGKVLEDMFPMDGIEQMNSFKRFKLEEAREQFKAAYLADDNQNFKGTAWGVINAYTDFITHRVPQGKKETKDEGKFMTVTFHPALMNTILTRISAVTGVDA